ncbi:MAG: (2Fe-2S)-binding protein [Armatimonadetes bacterium]|nr:(2Fe-2S)-binding protein [Armatimonadota bacterium]
MGTPQSARDDERVKFSYQGVPYQVPAGLTIMRALEMAGFQILHGSGCRAGFCGACATVYRDAGSPEVRVALACQTPLHPGMDVSLLSYVPVHRADYDVAASADAAGEVNRLYPELATCLGCNTCTKSCPVDLDVMGYVGALLSGDLPRVAELSFPCVSCGLCAARCPAGITPFTAALHARRAVGRRAPRAPELARRIAEVHAGAYDGELRHLRGLDRAVLEAAYHAREIRA